MKINVIVVKSFTNKKNEGNPAGIILDSDNLSDKQMIKISSFFGFSECAFVSESKKADFKIRFFTPIKEVNFCGHATIAAIYILIKKKIIHLKKNTNITKLETNIGILNIQAHKTGLIEIQQNKPKFFKNEINKKQISKLLNISKDEILNYPLKIISTGVPKLIIPVNSLKTLKNINPNLKGIKKYCKNSKARGFYPFTFETINENFDFHARQFNPLAGINEDPVTGVAAGALGAYAKKYGISKKSKIIIEQGYFLKKPGKIYVDTTKKIKVGGYAVIYEEKEINI